MKNFSLKLRLSIILLFLFAISSIIAISISMYQTKKTLVEVLDTQLYYFAKRVVNSNINTLINSSNLNYELNNINEDIAEKYMSIEDDSLTYAIYSLDSFNKNWKNIDSYAIAPKTSEIIKKLTTDNVKSICGNQFYKKTFGDAFNV